MDGFNVFDEFKEEPIVHAKGDCVATTQVGPLLITCELNGPHDKHKARIEDVEVTW